MKKIEVTRINLGRKRGLLSILKGIYFDLILEKYVESRYKNIIKTHISRGSLTSNVKTRKAYALQEELNMNENEILREFTDLNEHRLHGVPSLKNESRKLEELKSIVMSNRKLRKILDCINLEKDYARLIGEKLRLWGHTDTVVWYPDFIVFTPTEVHAYEFKSGKNNKSFTSNQRKNFKKLKSSELPVKIFILNADYDFPNVYEINVYSY